MFTHERHRLIADLIAKDQRMAVRDIQKALSISPATLRRDLAEMEKAGLLVRVHGGVVHPQALRGEPSFSLKSRKAVAAKRAMAALASTKVPDGATVFVDSGTTCLEIGRRLLARPTVRVVTNSVPLIAEAYQNGNALLALGGELRPISGALTAHLCEAWLAELSLEWAFLGASALNPSGALTTELSEAAIKQQLLAQARHKVLAADASKWGESALVRFAPWEAFDLWITSGPLPADFAATLPTAIAPVEP